MAMIQMDLPAANRFVSSLSKSLQALCHGCMDFDTEIEIVGYINVNIDCGSKVDYVLNEKVSKSTNNSMKFISNSFLAKQDQQKTDRSCSPIPELQVKPPSRAPAPPSYSSSQLYKSSGIFSPNSQVLRGSQKRAWSGGDWRSSHRKMARGPRQQYDSSYSSPSQHADYSSQQQTSTFPKPSTSQQDYSYSESSQSQSQVHVKSEAADETGTSYDQNISSGDTSNQDSSALVSEINIKTDPDSAETSNNNTSNTSFLHPQSTDGASYSGESSSKQSNNNQDVRQSESFFKTEHEDSAGGGEESGDYNNEQSNEGDNVQPYSESDVSFQTEEGQEYIGEESGDGSQFDIIEIDDEDEDLAAFTDEDGLEATSQIHLTGGHAQSGISSQSIMDVNHPNPTVDHGPGHGLGDSDKFGGTSQKIAQDQFTYDWSSRKYHCLLCGSQYTVIRSMYRHIQIKHKGVFPVSCDVCGRGFQSKARCLGHMTTVHGQPKKFKCSVCGQMYAHKSSLTQHLKGSHGRELDP